MLIVLVGAPFLTLLQHTSFNALLAPLSDPYYQRVIWFSFYQASISTVLSILIAIPTAVALARRNEFFGRAILIQIFSMSLIIPTIVAIFGIVAIYGRTGWINQLLAFFGLDWKLSVYGLTGILIAHVFFNMPLATRVFLQSLESIPETSWRTSAQLGMRTLDCFRLIEWPAIKPQIPALAILIFSLCFTSFAIVMTLGGGPKATTIEVAIYQALRFDFDLNLAVQLALIQFVICGLCMILATRGRSMALIELSTPKSVHRFRAPNALLNIADCSIITLVVLFTLTPMLALVLTALNPSFIRVLLAPSTVSAVQNTLLVGLASGCLSLVIGFSLLSTSRHLIVRLQREFAGKLIEGAGLLILVIPPIVLGTGLFLLLRPYADVFSLTLLLVILINALMGLPFVLRVLSVPMLRNLMVHDRLCSSLGVRGINRLKLIDWPTLRKPIGLSFALASTLSAGDLTAIALFGSERVVTLPLLLYQRMGSYRMYDASVTAFLLLLICLFLFWILDRGIGGSRVTTQ